MRIQDKTTKYSWAVDSLEELKAELLPFLEKGFIIPDEPGGWWHEYVCPTHHTELLFNPQESDAQSFKCPHGCDLKGEPYRGAWLVFKHQSLARYMLQSAAVYAATHDERFVDLAKSIIVRYAAQFPEYPVHPDAKPWMLKGRAFHQALTEAIWATTLIRGYVLLLDEGVDFSNDAEVIDSFFTMLEESMTQYRHILVNEKKNTENNYTAWLNAALSCVYAVRGEKDKLISLIGDEGGLIHHLSIGVKPDQLEFEGSIYYHIFVLRAYLITAEMSERFRVNLYTAEGEQGQSLKGMFDVLVQLANPQGELPALHDGPFKRLPYAREISEVFEIGMSKYQNPDYIPLLADSYRQLNKDSPRRGLEALVFGTGDWYIHTHNIKRSSVLLPDSGFACLNHPNNALSLLVDFGEHGGSHGHYDKLNIVLNHKSGSLAPELGVVPYGSDLRKSWFAETISHNTVTVGGKSQKPHEGVYEKFEQSPGYSFIHVHTKDAYPNCSMDRYLMLTEELLIDWFEVTLGEEQEIDWSFYVPGGISVPESWVNDNNTLGETYGHIHSISHTVGQPYIEQSNMVLTVDTTTANAGQLAKVSMSTLLYPTSKLYKVKSPGIAVDPSQSIDGTIHRQTTKKARFITVFIDGDMPVNIKSLGDHSNGEMIQVSIEEKKWSFILNPSGIIKI